MGSLIDIAGMKFGRLTVISRQGTDKWGRPLWLCACECGGTKVTTAGNLKYNLVQSCGCIRRKLANTPSRHGLSKTRAHGSWLQMIRRCKDPNFRMYPWYGAIGIRVCDRWLAFENFFQDMGERPDGYSLDRVDTTGDYEPNNCRWATAREQENNRGNNHLLTYNGETHTIAEWSRITGIKSNTLYARLSKFGWTAEQTITTPTLTPAEVGARKKKRQ